MTVFTVRFDDRAVGHLESDRGRVTFTYDRDAVSDDALPAISVRMPKRTKAWDDDVARPFFENLLPESEFRRLLAQRTRLSADNVAGLLGAIGGECSGAVSVWPLDEEPANVPAYEPLTLTALSSMFEAPEEDLLEAQRRGRLSLPGALPKITVHRAGIQWALSLDGAPTTHIIKRTHLGFSHLVENEFFCMRLAAACGLPVPPTELLETRLSLLAVERFDRVQADDRVRRRHQEDLCQATSTSPAAKYQVEGGPGFAACAEVLQQWSALPIADLRLLAQWAVFNYVIGNEDAHGKNVALLYSVEELRLAPFYDLVSTEVYRGLQRKAAMDIGGERRYRYLERRHWEAFGRDIGIPWSGLARVMHDVTEAIGAHVDMVFADVRHAVGDSEVLDRVRSLIDERLEDCHTLRLG